MLRAFDTSERWAILGAAGSGKSQFAKFIMNASPADLPFLFIDSKTDGLPEAGRGYTLKQALNRINRRIFNAPRLTRVFIKDPESEDEMNDFDSMCGIMLRKGYVGMLVDEAYMMPNVPNYRRLFTAGRSRRTPLIICMQRPVGVPRVCISEASRIVSFNLIDKRDRDTLRAYAPFDNETIDNYYAKYYDTKTNENILLSPIDMPDIRATMLNKT
jgi:hypothetical protein